MTEPDALIWREVGAHVWGTEVGAREARVPAAVEAADLLAGLGRPVALRLLAEASERLAVREREAARRQSSPAERADCAQWAAGYWHAAIDFLEGAGVFDRLAADVARSMTPVADVAWERSLGSVSVWPGTLSDLVAAVRAVMAEPGV
ncbi:hypothetical protein [Actinotalea solisilvae]|uniref:hypothetical protein n=1 Tax=Actinotalea solisilvae TaxID=2072922 RepID=UPI0018F11827|nr:hypothetical protein [Actinotalea solisilvae]